MIKNVYHKLSEMICLIACIFSASVGLCQDPRLQHSNEIKDTNGKGCRLPLGGSLTVSDQKVHLKIWMPTKNGGKLEISISCLLYTSDAADE